MAAERFHKAARDGALDVLKEATRKDCNGRDEDGMTPTLWAAFEGNLDALRLLVGRGGDPDRADNFGNSALHLAAARGHLPCVSFLANFGANLWARDVDQRRPAELAALNGRDEVLRFLDDVAARKEASDRKLVKTLKERAQKDAEKRLKEYEKMQRKADELARKEQKRLLKKREKMEVGVEATHIEGVMPHRPSTVLTALKLRPTAKVNSGGQRYSEIVSGGATLSAGAGRKPGPGGVQKKLQAKMQRAAPDGDFKVGEVEDGKRSLRSLTGLRRDSEIIYVGSYETQGAGRRGKLEDVFGPSDLVRSVSEPEFLASADSGLGEEVQLHEPASMFERPGFGSVVFRNNITATLSGLPRADAEDGSIGSAGSLAQRGGAGPWDDDLASDDDDNEVSALQLFLAAAGLSDYADRFLAEQIDLEALVLLTDSDLEGLGLQLGPRRKLMAAIARRRAALENPGEVHDSRL